MSPSRMPRISQFDAEVASASSRAARSGGSFIAMRTQALERAVLLFNDVRNEVGFGAVSSYRLTRHLALDGSFLFFPKNYRVADFQDGGRIMQALAGVRAGRQFGRLGVWLKARPSFQRYSLTANDFVNFPPANFPSIFHFALDLGGVLEFSVSRRTALRFDASDVMRFHREKTLEGLSFRIPAARYDTIQFSTAWVWRF